MVLWMRLSSMKLLPSSTRLIPTCAERAARFLCLDHLRLHEAPARHPHHRRQHPRHHPRARHLHHRHRALTLIRGGEAGEPARRREPSPCWAGETHVDHALQFQFGPCAPRDVKKEICRPRRRRPYHGRNSVLSRGQETGVSEDTGWHHEQGFDR